MQAYLHLQPAMSFDEIAAELGITKQGAHWLYQAAMRKLRSRDLAHGREMLADLENRRSYAKTSRSLRRRNRGHA